MTYLGSDRLGHLKVPRSFDCNSHHHEFFLLTFRHLKHHDGIQYLSAVGEFHAHFRLKIVINLHFKKAIDGRTLLKVASIRFSGNMLLKDKFKQFEITGQPT